MESKFTHGSLFSGIGGFDLAAEWMGWENVFHCEINDFCNKILNYYWPNAKSHTDIKTTDFTVYRGKIDILTGGFPCQPYSQAGKRKGKEDDRHLWPEMLRAIREIRPRWVVGENVRGLINWSDGLVFHEVQADLEAAGYEVFPFLLPAAGVNAPHERYRIWFVAHSISDLNIGKERGINAKKERMEGIDRKGNGTTRKFSGTNNNDTKGDEQIQHAFTNPTSSGWDVWRSGEELEGDENNKTIRSNFFSETERCSSEWVTSDSNSSELQRSQFDRGIKSQRQIEGKSRQLSRPFCSSWQDFPTQSPVCNGDDGISSRLDGITFPKWRNESIKGGGNAVVPQVVHQIFKAIQQYENEQ